MITLQEGATLQDGKYKIKKVLGQGGFGITYLAVQDLLDRPVAIKEFFFKDYCSRDSDTGEISLGTEANSKLVEKFLTKFIKEAKTISKLQHPNIIQIYDIFRENNTAYYVMEYIEGESLADLVKHHGALPENEAIGYIKSAASALSFIHDRNINHLDVKPGNIMMRRRDSQIILIDFGVAKQYDEVTNEGTTTTPVGISHGYSPLEQYRTNGVNTFSPQSDVYSLAATLYKLLCGNTPPEAMDIFENGLNIVDLEDLNVTRTTIDSIVKAMKTRDKRTQSIHDFMESLCSNKEDTKGNTPVAEEDADESTMIISDDEDEATQIASPSLLKPQDKPKEDSVWQKEMKRLSNENPIVRIAVASVVVLLVVALLITMFRKNPQEEDDVNNNILVEQVETGKPEVQEEEISVPKNTTVAEPQVTDAAKTEVKVEKQTAGLNDTKIVELQEEASSDKKSSSVGKGSSVVYTVNGVSFTMKNISKGKFVMGATSEIQNPYDMESPTHMVELRSFQIGETEVTQELWEAVMGTNPSANQGSNLPVESVSWEDCRQFIAQLNSMTGKKFRLPTEAEWEYAARGGASSQETQYSGNSSLAQVGWFKDNSSSSVHKVKSKKANEQGLYDMSGNVAEWCQDWFGAYSFSPQLNPKGPGSGEGRVVRGGGCTDDARDCRVSFRIGYSPNKKSNAIGFRLAL